MSSQKHQYVPPSSVVDRHLNSKGEMVEDCYAIGKMLGDGGFATCYEAINTATRERFAVKIIEKVSKDKMHKTKEENELKIAHEINITMSLNHPNIMKCYRSFSDERFFYMLLELCENNTLHHLLKKRKHITEPEIRFILFQLLNGIKYIHSEGIIHRDLKLANVLLDSNLNLKIGDFGLAIHFKELQKRKPGLCGTPNYIAPEVSLKQNYSYEVDIWSTGVMLYNMMFGRLPFEGKNAEETYNRIRSFKYKLTGVDNQTVSEEGINLIVQIFRPQNDRITLNQILNHPFLKNYGMMPRLHSSYLIVPPSEELVKFYSIPKNKAVNSMENEQLASVQFSPDSNDQNLQTIESKLFPDLINKRLDQMKTPKKKSAQESKIDLPTLSRKVFKIKKEKSNQKIPSEKIIDKFQEDKYKKTTFQLKRFEKTQKLELKKSKSALQFHFIQGRVRFRQKFKKCIKTIAWINCSEFGIAYLLSNKYVGLKFNDKTHLLASQDGIKFVYYYKSNGIKHCQHFQLSNSEQIICQNHGIKKKAQTLLYFKSKLNRNSHETSFQSNLSDIDYQIYAKNIIYDKSLIIFQFNNDLIQCIFKDKHSFLVSKSQSAILHINQKREETVYFMPISLNHEQVSITFQKKLKQACKMLSASFFKSNANAQSCGHSEKNLYEGIFGKQEENPFEAQSKAKRISIQVI